jgi:hypothetical protein
MHKLILALAFLVSAVFFASSGLITSAVAGDRCNDQGDTACELYRKQSDAPAYTGPKSGKQADRCVWVANFEPVALVLRQGAGVNGPEIISWRKSSLQWRQGVVNGREALLAQICFDSSILYAYDAVTLCAEVGHSIWRNQNMAYVRKHNVGKGDPACVGGNDWCGDRGL